MPDKVHLPVFGEVNKSVVVFATLGGIGGLAYALWKKKQDAAAAAAAAQTQQQQTANQPPSGYGYGYGAELSPYGYGYGPEGLGAYGGQGYYGYDYYGAGQEQVPTQAATNSEWVQAAQTVLTNAGWSAQQVLIALGLYISGAPVTSQQTEIIQAAIAAEGYPPQEGIGGYPPSIHTASGRGGPGQGTTVTVPNVKKQPQEAAYALITEAGLKPATTTPAQHGKVLYVSSQNPAAGTSVKRGSTVTVTSKANAVKTVTTGQWRTSPVTPITGPGEGGPPPEWQTSTSPTIITPGQGDWGYTNQPVGY